MVPYFTSRGLLVVSQKTFKNWFPIHQLQIIYNYSMYAGIKYSGIIPQWALKYCSAINSMIKTIIYIISCWFPGPDQIYAFASELHLLFDCFDRQLFNRALTVLSHSAPCFTFFLLTQIKRHWRQPFTTRLGQWVTHVKPTRCGPGVEIPIRSDVLFRLVPHLHFEEFALSVVLITV